MNDQFTPGELVYIGVCISIATICAVLMILHKMGV